MTTSKNTVAPTWAVRNVGSLSTDTVRNFDNAATVCRIQQRTAVVLFGSQLVAVFSQGKLVSVVSPRLAGRLS